MRRIKQRYSYLGIIVCLGLLVCALWLIAEATATERLEFTPLQMDAIDACNKAHKTPLVVGDRVSC